MPRKTSPKRVRQTKGARKSRKGKYAAASYRNISIDRLLVCAAKWILDAREECTFERLVCECYTLFPERFRFQRYPKWPDAVRIDGACRRCRTDQGWLAGNVKEGFRLTPSGRSIAGAIEAELETGRATESRKVPRRARERYEAILLYVKNSPGFLNFARGEGDISTSELRSFLGGTLETPKRILRQNLNLYLNAARIYEESSVVPFLNLCRRKLRNIKE